MVKINSKLLPIKNANSTETDEIYSCSYLNDILTAIEQNTLKYPTTLDCLMMDQSNSKGIMLAYNPSNAPEANKMVMWKTFFTYNTNPDSYWTYIVIAITLDDHKLWQNAYHNSTGTWTGWQQI